VSDLNSSKKTTLSTAEKRFYHRHLIMPEIGWRGQERLKQARVLVVGAGGLGAPLLQYLAAAGVGTIGIVDDDVVDVSNLHRQVLYRFDDVGKRKAEVARERLLALNPHLRIEIHTERLTSANALEIIPRYDIIADGTDNFPTRYLVNDACVLSGRVNVYASIFRFEGQVAVFNAPLPAGERSANYRDLYPTPPPPEAIPNCAESGVLGVLPGIVGSLQANEVIKLITGVGEALVGKLLLFDAKDNQMQVIQTPMTSQATIDRLVDYDLFCNNHLNSNIQHISAEKLYALLRKKADIQLIDVREPHEHEVFNLGGELIPLREITQFSKRIATGKTVVLYCQSGQRSQRAISVLAREINCEKVYNLEGGVEAYLRYKQEWHIIP
jgi:adenylyltransferase/sulfurtransferase